MSDDGPNALGEVPWLPPRRLVAALGLLGIALAVWAALSGATPPPPKVSTVSPAMFSAQRAREVLERVYRDVGPHPIGTAANRQVRARIEDELRALGLRPQVRRQTVCGGSSCGWVENIVARIDGQLDGPAVLLACHYDSVPAGPGIGDDGNGVGITIEVARALVSGAPPRHPVILLIDDGEEAGLFGARAFVEHDPWAKDVAVVVNVEARGTDGISNMFETKGPTRWILDAYLQRAQHPRVSSLATTVYERMPNDTDLTVFGEAGLPGLNFAFVGGGGRYHTPRDDLEHLSWSSVQHQGGEALAAVTALANEDLSAEPPPADDVFETVSGRVIRWPRPWSLGLALACLVVTLVSVGAGVFLRRLRLGRVLLSVVALLLALVATLGTLWLVSASTDGLVPIAVRFSSRASTLRLGAWMTVVAVIAASGWVLARFVRGAELLAAYSIGGASLAVAVAGVLPGASGMPIAIAVCSTVGLIAAVFGPHEVVRVLGLCVATVPGLAVAMELSIALHNTFGSSTPLVPGAAVGLAALGGVPWFAAMSRDRVPLHMGGAMLLCAWIVCALGAATLDYDRDNPYPVDLVLFRDARHDSVQWWAMSFNGPPPESMAAAGFASTTEPLLYGYPGYPGPTSEHEVSSGLLIEDIQRPSAGAGTVRGRLRSSRGSSAGSVRIGPPDLVEAIRIDGQVVAGRRVRASEGPAVSFRLHGLPAQGVPIEIETTSVQQLRVVVTDIAYGLPASEETQRFLATRPHWAAPLQFGDVDVVISDVSP